MSLTRVQRNGVYNALAVAGLDHAECNFKVVGHGGIIDHLPSEALFSFTQTGSVLSEPLYSGLRFVEDGTSKVFKDEQWAEVDRNIWEWAREILELSVTPDLWAEYHRNGGVIPDAPRDGDNSPFTADEQASISRQLGEIKNALSDSLGLSGEHLAAIESKLDEAEEASRRIGRKDWLLMFYGLMFTLIVTRIVPPDVVQHVIAMVVQGLSHLLGGSRPQVIAS
ncbi:MAG: hypothetical protein ACLP70_02575 [Streptosporangiaceae bacterium]|jgi:hypothetical protein